MKAIQIGKWAIKQHKGYYTEIAWSKSDSEYTSHGQHILDTPFRCGMRSAFPTWPNWTAHVRHTFSLMYAICFFTFVPGYLTGQLTSDTPFQWGMRYSFPPLSPGIWQNSECETQFYIRDCDRLTYFVFGYLAEELLWYRPVGTLRQTTCFTTFVLGYLAGQLTWVWPTSTQGHVTGFSTFVLGKPIQEKPMHTMGQVTFFSSFVLGYLAGH